MNIKAIITLAYGIIIAGGGIAGYIAAGSTPSLISGGVLGLAAIVGAILMFLGMGAGQPIAVIATLLVGGFFAYKLIAAISAGDSIGRAAGIVAISVIELIVLLAIKSSK
jgi:uncharacterized membrane protein (UPF0136 family)